MTTTPITNEVLASKLDSVVQNQQMFQVKLDALPGQIDHSYIRNDIFDLRMKEMDTQVLAIKATILQLQNRKTLVGWVTPTVSAILGSVLTYLIISQIQAK